MHFKKLDLNLLVALDHMLTLKSVSRAAERMNLTQSAMSNALTRLRSYFDDPLLTQVGRRMELTPKAQSMQHSIRDILVRIEATVDSEPAFDPASSDREFRIFLSDFTMTVLMPRVLELSRKQHARVRFSLLPQVESPWLTIERGEADLLITPKVLISSEHPSAPLFQEDFVCIAWSHGRFGKAVLGLDDYLQARHVQMVPPVGASSFEQQAIDRIGISRNIEVACYSFAALPHLVLGSDRLATVHRSLARYYEPYLPLTLHELPFSMKALEEHVQWHAYRDQDLGIAWLIDLMRQAAAQIE